MRTRRERSHTSSPQISRCLPYLRQAEGRLHFAGEHLGPLLFRGLAQAAMESGRSAANEILEARA